MRARATKRFIGETGLGLGALVAVPGVAQAEDFKVTNLNDDGAGSLRQAFERADADDDADRILFKSKLSGTIELGGEELTHFLGDLEIVGPGARKLAVDADDASRVFRFQGVYGHADVSVSGLTITGGNAYFSGGAIAAYGDTDLTLSRTTVSGSSAGLGGAIAAFEPVVIEKSTLSGNSADTIGGAIFNLDSDLTIINSTISGNSAMFGGAVYVQNYGANPSFELRNSTVTRNTAEGVGGLVEEDMLDTSIRGSIVAGNTDANNISPDLDEGPWATAFSLIGNPGVATIDDGGGNIFDVDPRLKPLKNNGGATNTHAFKKSPAKNTGPSDAPNSDQRGAPRKGKADIGAYELTKCKRVIVNRVGTAGKDKLKGTKKTDGILGLGGNDKLSGKKGKDGLCGGSGKDKLKGGPGRDKLDGGPGKDREIQ